jgi:hypothetical protein
MCSTKIYGNSHLQQFWTIKYKLNLQPIIWTFSQAESAFLQVEIFRFGLHTFLQFTTEPLKTENKTILRTSSTVRNTFLFSTWVVSTEYQQVLSKEVNQLWHEDNHLPPPGFQIKNTSTLPNTVMAQCFIKHSKILTYFVYLMFDYQLQSINWNTNAQDV